VPGWDAALPGAPWPAGPTVGNRPLALPGPRMELLCPVLVNAGNDPVNPTEPGAPTEPVAPVEPLAPLDPDDPDDGGCALDEPCGDEDDRDGDGDPDDGLVADGDGDLLGCGGVVTVTLPAALGGVQGSSVGTLAVADSVADVPAAPAGICACI
jgi:hypothetical protein